MSDQRVERSPKVPELTSRRDGSLRGVFVGLTNAQVVETAQLRLFSLLGYWYRECNLLHLSGKGNT